MESPNLSNDEYILLLLSDSNLPTGSFVASSGLESYITHGFPPSPLDFLQHSLHTYAHSALPFVSDAYRVVNRYRTTLIPLASGDILTEIRNLDELYDVTTLNHIAKRASKSQGVALLTLYSKGFSRPINVPLHDSASESEARLAALVDEIKMCVRREDTHGHLPICWGILTAALGLSLERAQYLHLFLHARSILSASIRLNSLGPYAAQQLLAHAVHPAVLSTTEQCKSLSTGLLHPGDPNFVESVHGPATTWPLGEILAARHDLQHSRIFNS